MDEKNVREKGWVRLGKRPGMGPMNI